MNLVRVFIFLSVLSTLTLCSSCKGEIAKPIPKKHADQSQGMYDKYLGLLKEAYLVNNNFEAAIQLANLKGDKHTVFELLNSSLGDDPNYCDKIYEWYWLYDKHNFGVNILKLDTVKFKNAIRICETLNKQNPYVKYAEMKDEEERIGKENKEIEDSTNFNLELVDELRQIYSDDQEIRKRLSAKNITPELEGKLFKEMAIVDSINLIKIDKIFKTHGYPSRELVGKDGNFTPALVIHHSASLEARYKYLPFLEKAVKDGVLYEGTLDMIKRRIEDMELDQKSKGKPSL